MEYDEEILICMPVGHCSRIVPGTSMEKCSKCGQEVLVAPSSLIILHDHPGIRILCPPCGIEAMEQAAEHNKEVELEPLTPAQLDELGHDFP